MTDIDYAGKLEELDRILNDPTIPMEPDRIWSLLAEVSHVVAVPADQAVL